MAAVAHVISCGELSAKSRDAATQRLSGSISCRDNQVHAVVVPDRWCGVILVRVENTDCEGFGHYRANVGFSYPPESGNFRVLSQGATDWAASKYQSYDATAHVFIDAGKRYGLDNEAGFFFDLTQQALCYRLTALKDAAGRFPVRIVSSLDNEGAPILIDHDTSNAHRVARFLAGHPVTPVLNFPS